MQSQLASARLWPPILAMLLPLVTACQSPAATSDSCRTELDAPAETYFAFAMHTTACYGTCPIYSVSVDGNGFVEFDGLAYAATTGVARHCVSSADLAQLQTLLADVRFFDRTDDYGDDGNCATDFPTVNLSAYVGERRNDISVYMGCFDLDEELLSLSDEVLDIVDARRYVYAD